MLSKKRAANVMRFVIPGGQRKLSGIAFSAMQAQAESNETRKVRRRIDAWN